MTYNSRVSPTPFVLSTVFLGLGGLHFLAPITTYNLFGLPVPRSLPETEAGMKPMMEPKYSPSPFVYANGGREISLGITFYLLGRQGNRDAIKAFLIAISVAAQVDAFIVWKFGGEQYGGWKGRWIMHMLGGLTAGVIALTECGL